MESLPAMSAAAVATIFSSPLNYVRNIKYSAPAGSISPNTLQVLGTLVTETRTLRRTMRVDGATRPESTIAAMHYMQQRLRIGIMLPNFLNSSVNLHTTICRQLGWGTARVAVGMATGSYLYYHCKHWLQQHEHFLPQH
jgi:hypothetical protein